MRQIHRFALLVLTWGVALSASPAQADLALNDTFPGMPLSFAAGGTSSTVTVSVTGTSSPHNLAAFQVALDFVPNGMVTGTLSVASPPDGTDHASEPANYVFTHMPAVNHNGLDVQHPAPSDIELFFSDINNPYTMGVPITTEVNLITFAFTSSMGAEGLWDIVARQGTTFWTDNQSPTQMKQYSPCSSARCS
jgi:hypothetical protein